MRNTLALCNITLIATLVTGPARAALADTAPATTPATSPTTHPKNLDKALQEDIDVSFDRTRLEDAVATLRRTTQTNIAVNWPALALAGITPDTPVTLHLAKTPYEQAVRAMLEQLPAEKTRPNYTVGENALEITTTAELGKLAVVRLYPIADLTGLSLAGEATAEQRTAHEALLKKVVHWQLVLAGEDVDGPGRSLIIKDDYLVATQSRRAQLFVGHTLQLFAAPVRINQYAPGTVLSVQAKKAQERMEQLVKPGDAAALVAIARDPAKAAPDLNVILLPGTAAELAKPTPDVDYLVTSGGIVMIGPAADIRGRVMLAVYDLGELLKRLAFRSKAKPPPEPAELAATVLAQLKEKVPPGRGAAATWGDLGKSPDSMTLYQGLLVVSAPPAAHRAITAALQEIYRQ